MMRCIHGSGGAGGHAGTGRTAPAHQRWAGLSDLGPRVGLPLRGRRPGMRNLAIVALTDAGRRVDEVAAVFGLTATYVSILRGRARTHGSVGLVARRGRPPKLSDRQVAQARV